MHKISVIFALCALLWGAEPSAFELQSGFTKQEMQSLKGKAESQSDKIFELENRLKQLETSHDGMKSIYEGQATKINELNNKLNSDSSEDFTALKSQVEQNAQNIQVLNESLKSVSDSIAQIKDLLGEIQKLQEDSIKDSKSAESKNAESKSAEATFIKDTKKRSEIFKEARRLTYSKNFSEAIARFNWFIEINYKKAESHYMLGNIAYEQNKYNDAIFHYKESATLDEGASYMPRLLLNCANSLRVLNRKEDAKGFYDGLISRFPNTQEAKDAKTQLKKMK